MDTHNAGTAKATSLRETDGWRGRPALLLLGSALVYGLLCVAANAEQATPPRIGNIYDGFNHQPTRSETEGRERAVGIAPGTRQQSTDDAALQQLYQQLKNRAATG